MAVQSHVIHLNDTGSNRNNAFPLTDAQCDDLLENVFREF